jgi:predicted ATP-dependent protease
VLKSATGFMIAPVINGQVLSPEAYLQLDKATRTKLEERQKQLHGEMAETMRLIRGLDKTAKNRLQDFDRQIADFAVSHLIDDVRQQYGHLEEVDAYLAEVHADLVENVDGFREDEDGEGGLASAVRAGQRQDLLRRYQVNLLVDNGGLEGAPVIFEPHPTHANLLGRIEHHSELGALVTDFTMIKAGALHRANGGFVVLEMDSLAANPPAWTH